MMKHIGTKLVHMQPMTRQQYNDLRGWSLPADEDGSDVGYLIEDIGGKPNMAGFAGYVSWSPAAQAEATYRPIIGMPFGLAIEAMKQGGRVARGGWNGKGMWLKLVKSSEWDYAPGQLDGKDENPCMAKQMPWIGMKTVDGCFVPWLASQTDMLADDWVIVP